MAPISTLLFLSIIAQFTKTQAVYLRPRSDEIITKFPPLKFPGPESTGDVSGLQKKLSDLEQEIKAMEIYKQGTTVLASATIRFIPHVGSVLQLATGALADHLMSVAKLENLSSDVQIQLGIKEALVKHSLSQFKAKIRVLKRCLEDLSSNISTASKRDSAVQAIPVCEEILGLFDDETYLFWEFKLIFYPHLMSFTGLYATVAAAAAKLDPEKLATIQRDMELLRTTVLKYHPLVKIERLSKLNVTPFRSKLEREYPRGTVNLRCPNFLVQEFDYKTFSLQNINACVPGDNSIREYTKEKLQWAANKIPDVPYSYFGLVFPYWYEDTVDGAIFCGLYGCWGRLRAYIENEIDNLTKSALKLIPFDKQPSQRLLSASEAEVNGTCQLPWHGRLYYLLGFSHKRVKAGFGCHKGYCWTYCNGDSWCYTMNFPEPGYARCERQEDCCPHWLCHKFICGGI